MNANNSLLRREIFIIYWMKLKILTLIKDFFFYYKQFLIIVLYKEISNCKDLKCLYKCIFDMVEFNNQISG